MLALGCASLPKDSKISSIEQIEPARNIAAEESANASQISVNLGGKNNLKILSPKTLEPLRHLTGISETQFGMHKCNPQIDTVREVSGGQTTSYESFYTLENSGSCAKINLHKNAVEFESSDTYCEGDSFKVDEKIFRIEKVIEGCLDRASTDNEWYAVNTAGLLIQLRDSNNRLYFTTEPALREVKRIVSGQSVRQRGTCSKEAVLIAPWTASELKRCASDKAQKEAVTTCRRLGGEPAPDQLKVISAPTAGSSPIGSWIYVTSIEMPCKF